MKPSTRIKRQVHDRRSTDTLAAGYYATIEVDDPLEEGGRLAVTRQLRGDPLARLHSHHQIDDAQYMGGRAFQRDFEIAERGPKAIDPTKEAVDGGMMPEPITEGQQRAAMRLGEVYRELGQNGAALIHDVLIHGRTMMQIAMTRGAVGEIEQKYLGRRFRECLDGLAKYYGFAMDKSR
jgi:hypothetical protein